MHTQVLLAAFAAASPIAAAPASSADWDPPSTDIQHRRVWDHPGWVHPDEGYEEAGEPADVAQKRADAVKEAFQFAWDGYYQ